MNQLPAQQCEWHGWMEQSELPHLLPKLEVLAVAEVKLLKARRLAQARGYASKSTPAGHQQLRQSD